MTKVNEKKWTYLRVDSINGVTYQDDLDDPQDDQEILTIRNFQDRLENPHYENTVYYAYNCEEDKEVIKEIQEKYGIK